MEDRIKLLYLDEEEGWQSIAYAGLKDKFDIIIPESLPLNITEIWKMVLDSEAQAILVDYRLNNSCIVSYTGDEVIAEIHKHNLHLPMFIITSFEDNALIECKEATIIRGKELLIDPDKLVKLEHIIYAGVNNYNRIKADKDKVLQDLQQKEKDGIALLADEEEAKFDAELYLSELDLDSNVRKGIITTASNKTLSNLLSAAQKLVELYNK